MGQPCCLQFAKPATIQKSQNPEIGTFQKSPGHREAEISKAMDQGLLHCRDGARRYRDSTRGKL